MLIQRRLAYNARCCSTAFLVSTVDEVELAASLPALLFLQRIYKHALSP
jgi:hypothetical protein